jgi:hypothetical protein
MNNQLELDEIKRTWIETAFAQFQTLRRENIFAEMLKEFTADDLHTLLTPPENVNWFGILFARLKRAGLIRRVSARASTRPAANGRLVSVWQSINAPSYEN